MQETNESLGSYLKRSREERNVSIEQVAYATRISLKMLRALEEDQHTLLPAPTFIRGYLQAYAKYVRLDTQDLMLRYQHHLATAPDSSKRGAIRSHYLYVRERYQEKRRFVLVIALFMVMLTVAGTYFVLKAKRDRNKRAARAVEQIQKGKEQRPLTPFVVDPEAAKTATNAKAEEAEEKSDKKPSESAAADPKPKPEKAEEKPAAPVVAAPAPPPPAPEPEKKADPAPAAAAVPQLINPSNNQEKTFNLFLRAEEDAWLRFQTDEGEVRDLTLRAGKAMVLRADKVIKIFSGNLGALKATLNGRELPSLAATKATKSAVLPEAEAANYKLPLFPQFQPKQAPKPPPTQSGESGEAAQ